MEIHEIRDGDVLVLAPDGSITDSEETSALEAKLGTALKSGGRLLVFDCTTAKNLTSSALRVLLLASRKLDRTEGRLVLCGMNGRLAKAIAISGFDKDVTVVATRDEALLRVREPSLPRPARKERKERVRPEPVPDPSTPPEPVAPEPVVPIVLVVPEVAVVPEVPAIPIEPAPSAAAIAAANAVNKMVDVLLDKLGGRVTRSADARPGGTAPANLDALATGLLAALRAGRP